MNRRSFLGSVGGGLLGAAAPRGGPGATPRGAAGEDSLWPAVRGQFTLDPRQIFFNCGTLGPCPRPVREAVVAALERLDAAPTYEYWARIMPRYGAIQAKAAALLGAREPEAVTFTHSTTEGINIVARGLELGTGDEIVTTTHEHPGGDSIWRFLEQKRGVRVRRYALPVNAPPDDAIVSGITSLLTPRTRLLAVSHVNYTNGLIMPVAALGRLAAERGLLYLVDGAHPVGQMPVDIEAIGCGFYAASGHKWLCGPRGTGILYVRPSLLERVQPLVVSYDFDHPPRDVRGLHGGAPRLNFAWTNNVHDLLGLEAAIDFHRDLGAARVRARCMALWRRFREGARRIAGLEAVEVGGEERSAPMLTLRVQGRPNTEVFRALKKRGITVKEVLDHELPEPINAIRVSTHVFNSESDVDALLEAVPAALAGA